MPRAQGHGEKLSRLQEQAIAALLTEPRLKDAAERCDISVETLIRWRQDPGFKAAYRAARQQVVTAAIIALEQAATAAVETLRRNLSCGVPGTEVQAARSILDHAIRAAELLDLEPRVEELERRFTRKRAT